MWGCGEGKGDGGHHSNGQHLWLPVLDFGDALLLHAGLTMFSLDGYDLLVQG